MVWRSCFCGLSFGDVRGSVLNRGEMIAQKPAPWDDFEWGMLNGKLSALRWVLGDEWDMLDT